MNKSQHNFYWHSAVGDKDDFGDKIDEVFYDGKTHAGPWAIMTPRSFRRHGFGRTGTGIAQKYEKRGGKWLKTEG